MRQSKRASALLRALALTCILLPLSACDSDPRQPPTAVADSPLNARAAEKVGLMVSPEPLPLPPVEFQNAQGRTMSLEAFAGDVVLLNLWATWCTPCREEMPALDRLQAAVGEDGFEVVPLSLEEAGLERASAFYRELDIRHLEVYQSDATDVGTRLAAPGLPTTILVDRQGRELARLVGAYEWDRPEMVALLKELVATTAAD